MMDVVEWIVSIFVVAVLYWITKRVIHRHEYPYRYTCSVCDFSFETNIRETYDISKSSHTHASLYEYKNTDPWDSPEVKEACKRFHPGEPCVPGANHPGRNG